MQYFFYLTHALFTCTVAFQTYHMKRPSGNVQWVNWDNVYGAWYNILKSGGAQWNNGNNIILLLITVFFTWRDCYIPPSPYYCAFSFNKNVGNHPYSSIRV